MTKKTALSNNEPSEDDEFWDCEEDDSIQSGATDGRSYARSASRQGLINLARYVGLHSYPKSLRVLQGILADNDIDYFTAEKDNPEYVKAFVIAALKVYRGRFKS